MTMQNSASFLRNQAIQAVKDSDWQQAVLANQEILEKFPKDLEAMNRLGLAYLRTNNEKAAKKIFKTVIDLDRSNIIANKHLNKIKNKEKCPDVVFNSQVDFIEEPGKSKIISLHRLCNRVQLGKLKVGQSCYLQAKKRYISVVDEDKKHVGALPEDISFRLSKLISRGNEYACAIYKIDDKQCCVQLKEAVRSKKNAQIQSFPNKKLNVQFNIGEEISLDDVPLEIISTDEDDNSSEMQPENGLKIAMEKIGKKRV